MPNKPGEGKGGPERGAPMLTDPISRSLTRIIQEITKVPVEMRPRCPPARRHFREIDKKREMSCSAYHVLKP